MLSQGAEAGETRSGMSRATLVVQGKLFQTVMCVKMWLFETIYIFCQSREERQEGRQQQAEQSGYKEGRDKEESQQDPSCACFALKRSRLPQWVTLRQGLISDDKRSHI